MPELRDLSLPAEKGIRVLSSWHQRPPSRRPLETATWLVGSTLPMLLRPARHAPRAQVPVGHPGHMMPHGPATNEFECPLPVYPNSCGEGLVVNMSLPADSAGYTSSAPICEWVEG